ncbi:MAG: hypothetical protein Q8L27_01615 [archaeon]|nr:hypothetical protein [archaeon]
MSIIKPSEVVFANDKLEKSFDKLPENDEIKIYIRRAINQIKTNAYCGTQYKKNLIPAEYVKKYKVNNLWKYDLPDGWRLIYALFPQNKVEILSVIIEWFNHKNYDRRFHYSFI